MDSKLRLQIYSVILILSVCTTNLKSQEDMVFCPGPASIPSPALVQPVVWSGTVFSGECPDDSVTLSGLIPTNIGDTFPCGRFTITVTNVEIVPINPTVNVTRLASTLNFTSDSSNNGQSVMCATAGNPPQENFNIIVPGVPTPTVYYYSSSLTQISINFTVTDTRCPSLVSLYIAEVIPADASPIIITSPTPSVSVGGLDLCRNTYSVVGYIEAPTGSEGSRSLAVNIVTGITGVADVIVSPSGLEWTQLPNSPLQDCITGYHISWASGEFTTNDSNTSLSKIPGFPYCQTVTVTVAPNTPNGVVTDGSSSSTGLIQHPDYIIPRLDAQFFLQEGSITLMVTVQETVSPGEIPTQMYGVVREGNICQPANIYSGYSTLVFNETQAQPNDQFTVCFLYQRFGCIDNLLINRTVPSLLMRSPIESVMTDVLTVTVSLPGPASLPVDSSQLSILSTISPAHAEPVIVNYPTSGSQYIVEFSGLTSGTQYTYDIRIVHRKDITTTIGLPIREDTLIPIFLGTEGSIALAVVLTFLLGLVLGVVVGGVSVCLYKRRRPGESSGELETEMRPTGGVIYEEPDFKSDPTIASNPAYGHVQI